METKYLTEAKLILLEDAIGFISDYKSPDSEIHLIKNDGDDETNIKKTEFLRELGDINKRRLYLINELMK